MSCTSSACSESVELLLHAQWVCILQTWSADTCGVIPRLCMHQYATSVRVTMQLYEGLDDLGSLMHQGCRRQQSKGAGVPQNEPFSI